MPQTKNLAAASSVSTGLRPGTDNSVCGKCGARRIDSQIGLEQTPAAYVAQIVAAMREVWRVLRDDGTLWLNLGDSYANNGVSDPSKVGGFTGARIRAGAKGTMDSRPRAIPDGLKPKDLMGIPWRVAFALQDDGWYLRSDIVWAKPNPMPESVTDRPTKAHEYVFLLAKQPRYFYDAEAIKEANATVGDSREAKGRFTYDEKYGPERSDGAQQAFVKIDPSGRNARSVWTIATQPYSGAHFATMPPELARRCILAGSSARGQCPKCGAPWTRVVEKGLTAHDGETDSAYEKGTTANRLAKLRQAARERGEEYTNGKVTTGWLPSCSCDSTGATFEPDDFEVVESPTGERAGDDPSLETGRAGMNRPRGENEGTRPMTRYQQRRYASQLRESPHREAMADEASEAFAHYIRVDRSGARPVPPALLAVWIERGWLTPVAPPVLTPYDPVPQIVLDPFAGSGTTAMVALQNGRRAIGTELNPKYLRLQDDRTQVTMGLGL